MESDLTRVAPVTLPKSLSLMVRLEYFFSHAISANIQKPAGRGWQKLSLIVITREKLSFTGRSKESEGVGLQNLFCSPFLSFVFVVQGRREAHSYG